MKKLYKYLLVSVASTVLLLGAIVAQAQETYLRVAFHKVAPESRAAYIEWEREMWKPVNQASIDSGRQMGWYIYEVRFPTGSSAPYNFVAINVFDDLDTIGSGGFEQNWRRIHPNVSSEQRMQQAQNLRETVGVDIWHIQESVLGSTPAPVLGVSLMKVDGGPRAAREYLEVERMWKEIHQLRFDESRIQGWAAARRVFPGGALEDYNFITMNGQLSQSGLYGQGNPLEEYLPRTNLRISQQGLMERTGNSRTQQRSEVWRLVEYATAD